MRQSRIRLWIIALCGLFGLLFPLAVEAQDPVPEKARRDRNSGIINPSHELQQLMQFVPVCNPMPESFKNTGDNQIIDPDASLDKVWEKISKMESPMRIVHIGDSHVRGHVFPYVVRKNLEHDFGDEAVLDMEVSYRTSGLAHETGRAGIVYHIIGVNGATCATFSTDERIRMIIDLNPDLVIVSFGTNEAHGRRYSTSEHLWQMQSLIDRLRNKCPDLTFLITTPPGAYVRSGRRGRVINPRTASVVKTEQEFAETNHLALWDMYHIVGGEDRACRNWLSADMYQRDRIHFTVAGYTLQGLLLHEALIKAYNTYVAIQQDRF